MITPIPSDVAKSHCNSDSPLHFTLRMIRIILDVVCLLVQNNSIDNSVHHPLYRHYLCSIHPAVSAPPYLLQHVYLLVIASLVGPSRMVAGEFVAPLAVPIVASNEKKAAA